MVSRESHGCFSTGQPAERPVLLCASFLPVTWSSGSALSSSHSSAMVSEAGTARKCLFERLTHHSLPADVITEVYHCIPTSVHERRSSNRWNLPPIVPKIAKQIQAPRGRHLLTSRQCSAPGHSQFQGTHESGASLQRSHMLSLASARYH